MQPSSLAAFVDDAINRCAHKGASLRSVAAKAGLAPSLLSQIRNGKTGVAMPRVEALAVALMLSDEDRLEFLQLVRSDQAKRAVVRGTSYVQDLEFERTGLRRAVNAMRQWMKKNRQSLPEDIVEQVAEAMDECHEPPIRRTQLQSPPFVPWLEKPEDQLHDLQALEARDTLGNLIVAEYRIRVRDANGLLVHGDIFLATGAQATLSAMNSRYIAQSIGPWPPGWYQCEVIRKAVPEASVIIAWKSPDVDSRDERVPGIDPSPVP